MKIDGLMSLQGVYDNTKLGLDYQKGFQKALEKAKENQESKEVKKVNQTDEKELRKAVQGFEAYFIHQILKQARASLPSGGLFPESNAKGIYEDMLDEARAEKMTDAGGIGLTETLMKQLGGKKYIN